MHGSSFSTSSIINLPVSAQVGAVVQMKQNQLIAAFNIKNIADIHTVCDGFIDEADFARFFLFQLLTQAIQYCLRTKQNLSDYFRQVRYAFSEKER